MQYLAMEIHFSRYAFMQNLQTSRVNINSLVTEEMKDFSAVTVALLEQMKRCYTQKMYINVTLWLQAVLTNLWYSLILLWVLSEVTLNTVLSSH